MYGSSLRHVVFALPKLMPPPEDVVTSRDLRTPLMSLGKYCTYPTTYLKIKGENDLVSSNIHHPRNSSVLSIQKRPTP